MMSEQAEKAFDFLRYYQLLAPKENDLARINEILERYNRFRHLILNPNLQITRRVYDVIIACETIENEIQRDAEREGSNVDELRGQSKDEESSAFTEYFLEMRDKTKKLALSYRDQPLPPEDLNNPRWKILLPIYEKINACTHKQKIRVLERLIESKIKVGIPESEREPNWKQRQYRLRGLEDAYLLVNGFALE